jgi:hypothetical protein
MPERLLQGLQIPLGPARETDSFGVPALVCSGQGFFGNYLRAVTRQVRHTRLQSISGPLTAAFSVRWIQPRCVLRHPPSGKRHMTGQEIVHYEIGERPGTGGTHMFRQNDRAQNPTMCLNGCNQNVSKLLRGRQLPSLLRVRGLTRIVREHRLRRRTAKIHAERIRRGNDGPNALPSPTSKWSGSCYRCGKRKGAWRVYLFLTSVCSPIGALASSTNRMPRESAPAPRTHRDFSPSHRRIWIRPGSGRCDVHPI